MNFNINVQTHAQFKAIIGKNGKAIKETNWFCNEVLDTGLARMSEGVWIDRCCVGTGNSTPLASQVTLDSFVASTTATSAADTSGVQVSSEPFYLWVRRTWRFPEGVATGNLSEVGLGWGNANLWNRALMRDINGDPTTITVLSDEYLDVVSEVRIYPQKTLSGSFNLLDKNNAVISEHTYTGYAVLRNPIWRAQKIELAKSTLNNQYFSAVHSGDITSNPSTADVYGIASAVAIEAAESEIYTSTSCSLKYLLVPDRNNYEHKALFLQVLNMMGYESAWGYKFQIAPSIVKNNEKRMNYTLKLSWGRYTP